ncbi:MAG: glycerate kinase, partial [Pseudomonadota bacterium]
MKLTVLVAPSGFKGSISARQAADLIATGVLRGQPDARIIKAPLVDGGEGFTDAITDATDG